MHLLLSNSAYTFFNALVNALYILQYCISISYQKYIKCIIPQYNIFISPYMTGSTPTITHFMHFEPLHIGARVKGVALLYTYIALNAGGIS